MHRGLELITILSLVGCKPEDDPLPLVTVVDAGVPERVELASAVGRGTVTVPVRLLNRYGAAVEGGDLELSVSGATASIENGTVSIDPTGYGELVVTTAVPEPFTVSGIRRSNRHPASLHRLVASI